MAGNTWKPEPPPTRPGGADVLAGLSVALVLIPQSMAYAELAGLPPHIGLFAAALPPILASLAASSPYLRSEEHTSELQSPYVISYAVFCL